MMMMMIPKTHADVFIPDGASSLSWLLRQPVSLVHQLVVPVQLQLSLSSRTHLGPFLVHRH